MTDPIILVSSLVAVGVPATIIFCIAKYWKTAWWLGLASSVAAILVCFLMALEVDPTSRQDTSVKLMWAILWLGGCFGIVACFASGILWYYDRSEKRNPPRTMRDIAYPPKRFNKYDV